MTDLHIRPWRREDLPRLTQLWQTAFGDSLEYIDAFRSHFLQPDSCLVAEADGRAVSAMYILDGPLLFPPDGTALSSAYTYALATAPAYRGRGIGTAVYRACVAAALERADAACVLPAEPSLYPFYEKAAGCRPVSYVREGVIPAGELSLSGRPAGLISPGEYYLRRKSLLRGTPYAVVSGPLLQMESLQMQRAGGGFVSLEGDIAAVEMDGGLCRVLELISPTGSWRSLLEALAVRFPAERYAVRTPVYFPGPGEIRPFMLAALAPTAPVPPVGLWWGLALD